MIHQVQAFGVLPQQRWVHHGLQKPGQKQVKLDFFSAGLRALSIWNRYFKINLNFCTKPSVICFDCTLDTVRMTSHISLIKPSNTTGIQCALWLEKSVLKGFFSFWKMLAQSTTSNLILRVTWCYLLSNSDALELHGIISFPWKGRRLIEFLAASVQGHYSFCSG